MRRSPLLLVALAALAAFGAIGCGSGGGSSPAGDASVADDGSTIDGGATADAAPPAVAISCNDAITDVYVTPQGLPAFTDATRGDVVRCAADTTIDVATMTSRLGTAGVTGVTATSGAVTYRIAFRTKRFDGSAAASSARVYIPTTPRSGPLPVVVATHGTTGLSDLCAPSRYDTVSDYLVLPFVAHGYAVIAPDYAGLGNEGVQGYGDNIDTAYSTLDAARALRKLSTPGSFAAKVIVAGHSQGGGAAFSAQALARTYGDSDVVGVVGFAPGWQVGVDVSGYRADMVQTTYGAGVPAALASLFVEAYFTNRVGATHAGDGFAASARAQILQLVSTQCVFQLAQSVPPVAPTFGQLFDPTFRTSVIDCADGRTCVEPGMSYLAFLRSNVLTADKLGAKVLVVQGLADTIASPANVKCEIDKIVADGVTPQVCVDMAAQHLDVTQRNAAFVLKWIDALVDGAALPTCDGSGLPACQ